MSHAKCRGVMAVATLIGAVGCNTDATAPKPSLDPWGPGCGTNGTQLRSAIPALPKSNGDVSLSVMPPGEPQRLEQVIVYGNPVQRPWRGYGDITSYGGMTITYTYQRDALDECSFGDGRTGVPVGEVADDTLTVSDEAPEGISQDLWRTLTPRVRRQLLEAAYYLAEYYLLNEFPELGELSRDLRRAYFFALLAKGFQHSQDITPDRRRLTLEFALEQRQSRVLSPSELLRLDAFLLGCSTASQYRFLDSWTGEQVESWTSRVIAGWAADQTGNGAMQYLEPHLSTLGALGAVAGRYGTSCAQAAEHHFRQVSKDLFDPGSLGGGNGTEF